MSQEDYDRATTTDYELVPSTTRIKSKALRCYFQWGTSKVNSSRKTVLQRERDSKINVTMPAGHTLPLTFAFDFTASYFRISSVVPEPVIFKRFRFRLRFRPQPSGSTGSGTGSGFASLLCTTAINTSNTIRTQTGAVER